MACEVCGHELQIGEFPFCPHGFGSGYRGHDEIPGGVLVENLGPQPIRFDSQRAIDRYAKSIGRERFVRHVAYPGSDKSPFTQDFSRGSIDAQTLENARVLASRNGSARGSNDEPSPDPRLVECLRNAYAEAERWR